MFGLVTGGTTRLPYLMTSALPRSPTAPVAANLPAQNEKCILQECYQSCIYMHRQISRKDMGPDLTFTIYTTKAALEKMHHYSNVGKKCRVPLLGLCPTECLQKRSRVSM